MSSVSRTGFHQPAPTNQINPLHQALEKMDKEPLAGQTAVENLLKQPNALDLLSANYYKGSSGLGALLRKCPNLFLTSLEADELLSYMDTSLHIVCHYKQYGNEDKKTIYNAIIDKLLSKPHAEKMLATKVDKKSGLMALFKAYPEGFLSVIKEQIADELVLADVDTFDGNFLLCVSINLNYAENTDVEVWQNIFDTLLSKPYANKLLITEWALGLSTFASILMDYPVVFLQIIKKPHMIDRQLFFNVDKRDNTALHIAYHYLTLNKSPHKSDVIQALNSTPFAAEMHSTKNNHDLLPEDS